MKNEIFKALIIVQFFDVIGIFSKFALKPFENHFEIWGINPKFP